MRKFEFKQGMQYERTWYDRVPTLSLKEILFLIDNNNALNQSAAFKYSVTIRIIVILTNNSRDEDALYLINHYWKKLDKNYLAELLISYGSPDLFKFVWNKVRLTQVDILYWFNTDDSTLFEWLAQDKKFKKLINAQLLNNLTMIQSFGKTPNFNQRNLDIFLSIPEVINLAVEHNIKKFMPEEIKNAFLF